MERLGSGSGATRESEERVGTSQSEQTKVQGSGYVGRWSSKIKMNTEERGREVQKRNSGSRLGGKHGERHRRAGRADSTPGPCLQESNEPRPSLVPSPSSHQYQGYGPQQHTEHRAEHHQLQRERSHPPWPSCRRRRPIQHLHTCGSRSQSPASLRQRGCAGPAPAAHSALARRSEEHVVFVCWVFSTKVRLPELASKNTGCPLNLNFR